MGSNCRKRSKCLYLIKGRNFYQLTKNISKLVKGGTAATSEMVISIFGDSICKKWKFRHLTSVNVHIFNGFNGCKEWQCCNLIGGNFHPTKTKVEKKTTPLRIDFHLLRRIRRLYRVEMLQA